MFDTHCHLTDDAYGHDLGAVLDRAREAGVNGVVTIASNADDAAAAETLAALQPDVWWTSGVHPHEAGRAVADLPKIRGMLGRDGLVAIGETGLDYHYDNAPRDVQRRAFDAHLRLAADAGIPAVVHSRSADEDTVAAIRNASGVTGVLHCFSGGAALLEAGIEAGWYFSYGGMVTFRNWKGAELLRRIPVDRLLLETDGPYLAPVPHRGRRNEPAFLALALDRMAELLSLQPGELDGITDANARRFYGLD